MITRVRKVRVFDWSAVEELGVIFYQEAPELGEFEPKVFSRNWQEWIDIGIGIAFVLECDRRVRGFIGALIAPEACCDKKQAQEMAWFVHPQARGQGSLLLRKLEVECLAQGCSTLAMIALRSLNADRLDRVYRRWGYEPVETLYRKNLSST